jgi:hypothetical protein
VCYKIEAVPGEPAILVTLFEQHSIARDMPNTMAEVRVMLDNSKIPMFLIMDSTRLSPSIDEIIAGSNLGARGAQPIFQHPNLREVVVVATSKLLMFAVRGLDSIAFGGLNANVFETIAEAIDYVHSRSGT